MLDYSFAVWARWNSIPEKKGQPGRLSLRERCRILMLTCGALSSAPLLVAIALAVAIVAEVAPVPQDAGPLAELLPGVVAARC